MNSHQHEKNHQGRLADDSRPAPAKRAQIHQLQCVPNLCHAASSGPSFQNLGTTLMNNACNSLSVGSPIAPTQSSPKHHVIPCDSPPCRNWCKLRCRKTAGALRSARSWTAGAQACGPCAPGGSAAPAATGAPSGPRWSAGWGARCRAAPGAPACRTWPPAA